ncbi:MAG: type VI secretion system ATPase TssH [Planctomycetota bacterium]|nr:type VI secretion system ATPase TssH [Planctomycetota bacterium]
MAGIPRAKLFGKLNAVGYKALDGAVTFCKLRNNAYVELVHWLHQLMQTQDSDLHKIIKAFNLDVGQLVADTQGALDRIRGDTQGSPDLATHLVHGVEKAWTLASLKYGEHSIRTGHVVLAFASDDDLKKVLFGISKQFLKVNAEQLAEQFAKITDGSPEAVMAAAADRGISGAPGEASGAMAPAQLGKQEALGKYCKDLTENARSGKQDPIVGRDEEIRQCIDILMRRRQNNPILTGEAGVGKTAVVEGFAQRIVKGDVPPQLKDVRLLELDVGLLQAGASMKGEFENRLRQVIDEVQASPRPIILFIDEAHSLMGAGGAAGTGDAAQLLKPALARGTLRTVAATTQSEYKQHIEKDPAMSRRFQVVKVDEPDEAKCLLMIRGLADVMEKHFKVQVLDEALEAAVKLSKRYIQGRQLPDKAVSLIDTACARVAVSLHATPGEIDDLRKRIDGLNRELAIVDKEIRTGGDHAKRREELVETIAMEQKGLDALEARYAKEKEIVAKILDLRGKLAPAPGADGAKGDAAKPEAAKASAEPKLSDAERAKIKDELTALKAQLAEFQGESPLMTPSVDAQAVSGVVSDWTGIPLGRMVRDEMKTVLTLGATLEKRVIGQRHALDAIAQRIQLARAKLDNPGRPVGVFLLVGPSGVGKTETAIALAEALYGGPQGLITINMSEYQEAHKVSLLMGSPPGYVGYGKGGVMTEAVRRRPYSVLLLDEVEKAHADVHEIFFQVFDKGMMKDSEGVDINFQNTIILLTSNVGTDLVMKMCKDPSLRPDPEGLVKGIREPLLKVFPPALLGRLNIVPYYPISDEMMRAIITLQLSRVGQRVREGHKVPFSYDPAVEDLIVSRVTELDSGARAIDAIITRQMLPVVGRELLERLMEGRGVHKVHVGVKDSEFQYSFE